MNSKAYDLLTKQLGLSDPEARDLIKGMYQLVHIALNDYVSKKVSPVDNIRGKMNKVKNLRNEISNLSKGL